MTFKDAVKNTAQLKYRDGLQAVKETKRIDCKDSRKLDGSVDIDACTHAAYPNAPRWDYAIGYDCKIYFLEVHPASSSNVKEVIDKLEWLKGWLKREGASLDEISKGNPAFSWVASGKISISKSSKEYRMAAQKNLLPKASLKLV